jgi:pyridoxine 5-phosphate synthase
VTLRRLIVELDGVAWLRSRSPGSEPNPVTAAALAQLGGAGGVALRLGGEPGTALERDARLLRETARCFQLVLPATSNGLKVALEIRPDSVIWTGEGEHGCFPDALDLLLVGSQLGALIRTLGEARIRSSVLIAPDPQQVKAAHRAGVQGVRLAAQGAASAELLDVPLREVEDCARLATKVGLKVGVMGVLDREHLSALAAIDAVAEFQVGPALLAQAVFVGMEQATRELVALLRP